MNQDSCSMFCVFEICEQVLNHIISRFELCETLIAALVESHKILEL